MLHRYTFRAMAAENEVQVHSDDARFAAAAAARAIEEVARIEAKYSRYRADSVVSRINAAAGGQAVGVDEETGKLLAFADACFRQSAGRFDATSGVLRRAWRFQGGRVPTQAELDALLPLVGWDRVELQAGVRAPAARRDGARLRRLREGIRRRPRRGRAEGMRGARARW